MEILKCVNYLTHKFTKLFDSKQLIASYNGCHPEQEEMMVCLIYLKRDERDRFHFLPPKKEKKERNMLTEKEKMEKSWWW